MCLSLELNTEIEGCILTLNLTVKKVLWSFCETLTVFASKNYFRQTKRYQMVPQLTWLWLYRYCWAGGGGCVHRNCPRYVRSDWSTWFWVWPLVWFPWWLAAGAVCRTTSATGWTLLLCSSRLRSLLRTRRMAIIVPLLPTIFLNS